ncbi:tetratricopeptide repeat protein [Gracilimonas sp. BCB1]|uniref:tetratricopeptide repeat protein n=1 Tax=Gracilimonas sp. BCB1 TaxID=3152362 RepID=UPI0032D952C8
MKKEPKYKEWIDLVVYLTDIKYLNSNKIAEWDSIFNSIRVVCPAERPAELGDQIGWRISENEEHRSDIWNEMLEQSSKEWTLFVEDDEVIQFNDFPNEAEVNDSQWAPALIVHTQNEKIFQHYQIRLVQKGKNPVFDGKNLPDCTRFITENEIGLASMPIMIERETNPVQEVNPSDELTLQSYSTQLYLVQGDQYFKEGKYVHAAAQYRQLLKKNRLLPFDRLGAVNGLASCLAEQYKWPQALALTKKSLEAEPLQSLPYLIQFKIFQLQKKWKEAYQSLNSYYERLELYSLANFDVKISEEETLINLADLALKSGLREEASKLLNELFAVKNGEVDRAFLHQLLVLSIELRDYKESVFFFDKMFEDKVGSGALDDEVREELNDYMTMFMQNEWHEFVYELYWELYNSNPQIDEYRRRLIVASVKTNRVEQAQKLVAKVA